MDEPRPGLTHGQSEEVLTGYRMISGHLCNLVTPPPTPYATIERPCGVQSYVQMNTGVLIRPACSSTNPGIWGTVLPLPKDQLPQGDTDPMDVMSTLRGCLGVIVVSEVLS